MTNPSGSNDCTATASDWFAEHGYLNEAVDHALASGDATRAVDLVEQDETNLLEQSNMTTLLAIVKKLPPQLVVSRARLQLTIAWANMLLQRLAPAAAALKSLRGGAGSCRPHRRDAGGSECRSRRACAECGDMFADRVGNQSIDLVAEALSRPDTFHPRVPGGGGKYCSVRRDLPLRLRRRAPTAARGRRPTRRCWVHSRPSTHAASAASPPGISSTSPAALKQFPGSV